MTQPSVQNKGYDPSLGHGRHKNGIPFSKPTLTKNELKSVLESLVQGEITTGATVATFEKEFAHAFEFQRGVALPSLTSAYHLALLAIETKTEDEIILPATTPVAVLDAIGHIGALPVLVDIARDSFHPNIEEIMAKITPKTKAIILSYPYGSFKDYDPLRESIASSNDIPPAQKKQLKIIEDITYVIGSELKGHFVGGSADIAIASLHEDGLMTIGKGAMLLTDSSHIFAIAKDLRMHGGSRPYRVRFDYSITDYQAAMGLEQLSLLPSVIERRRKIGRAFLEAVKNTKMTTYFNMGEVDVYGAFPILFDTPLEHTLRYFQSLNIETRRALAFGPLHQMLALPASDYPAAERLYQKALLIPLYPYLTKMNIERITGAIRGFY